MQVDIDGQRRIGQRRARGVVLLRRDADVEVPVRAKSGLRVEPRRRPPFDDQRVNTRRVERPDNPGKHGLVNCRLKLVEAVGLPQLLPDG